MGKNKNEIEQLIRLLQEMQDRAELRANSIIENGRDIEDVERAKADGFVAACSFCVAMLKSLSKENRHE